jgi:ankyrin repeat protein
MCGHVDAVCTEMPNFQCVDVVGHTALHYACARDSPANLRIIEHLLRFASDTAAVACLADQPDAVKGSTPLHVAASAGATECIRLLLSHSKQPMLARSVDGYTPLHAAAASGQTACCNILLSRQDGETVQALIHTVSKTGASPLALAAKRGCVDTCRLLLRLGCNKAYL